MASAQRNEYVNSGSSELHGVGIGLRRPHFQALLETTRRIDFLELVPEVFLGVGGTPQRVLHALRERYRLIPHGVSLSLGGPDPLEAQGLAARARLCRELKAPFFSDHACLSSIDGIQTFDLLPLPFHEIAAEHLAARCLIAADAIERPLLLENISYYALMPGSEWDEGHFLHQALEQGQAGLLLDVSNVLVNARNHGLDPLALLERLPLSRTRQIHLAGHRFEASLGLWLDDHASPVSGASLALYEQALLRIGWAVPTLIEWDQRVPSLDVLLEQADRVRALQQRIFPRGASGTLPQAGA